MVDLSDIYGKILIKIGDAMKIKPFICTIFLLSSSSQILMAHHHYHGNGIVNILFGLSYSVSGVLTTTEGAVVHNHHHYHRRHHCHWKKKAGQILKDIKVYKAGGEISNELKEVINRSNKIKKLKDEDKISQIEIIIKKIVFRK